MSPKLNANASLKLELAEERDVLAPKLAIGGNWRHSQASSTRTNVHRTRGRNDKIIRILQVLYSGKHRGKFN